MFDHITYYSAARLSAIGFPSELVKLLSKAGLPTFCAPNMYFGPDEDNSLLSLVELENKRYALLGSDRDDVQIGVDLDTFTVWALPAMETPSLVAGCPVELFSALDLFQACIDSAISRHRDAYTNERISPEFFHPFIEWASETNPNLLEPMAFWRRALVRLGVPNNSFKPKPLRGSA
jgi:hypothetical protein